jgi:hypothetical protein
MSPTAVRAVLVSRRNNRTDRVRRAEAIVDTGDLRVTPALRVERQLSIRSGGGFR